MSLFRLEIAVPKTNTANAFTIVLTESDHAVQRAEVELHKEKRAVAFLSVALFDPGFAVLSKLPDPEYADVPVALYLSETNKSQPVRVFEGLATRYAAQYPQSTLELVAHDRGVAMRRQARVKSWRNLTPIQLVQRLAEEYGLTVDSNVGDVLLPPLASVLQMGAFGAKALSDWDICQSLLKAHGLTMHVTAKKVVIRQTSTQLYPVTFRPEDGNVISLQVSINHVKSPGGQGNVKDSNAAFDNAATRMALTGKSATDATKQKGGAATVSRLLPVAAHANTAGAHPEDTMGGKWSNVVTNRRGRKDDGSLVVNAAPGVTLDHLVPLAGFGGKVDGQWEVLSVRHVLVPDEGGAVTTLGIGRGTSKGSGSQSGGLAFEYKGVG